MVKGRTKTTGTVYQRSLFGGSEIVEGKRIAPSEIPFVMNEGGRQRRDPKGWHHVYTVEKGTTLYSGPPGGDGKITLGRARRDMRVGGISPPFSEHGIVCFHVQVLIGQGDGEVVQDGDQIWLGMRGKQTGWMR